MNSVNIFLIFIITLSYLESSTNAAEDKVVGGERAPPEYPYQISLQVKLPFYLVFMQTSPNGWTHNCGGSIVTTKHVLTAAHCLKGFNASQLSIWAGTETLNGSGKRYMVDDFIIHPSYVELITSDIGIVMISNHFGFSKKIAPIKYSGQRIGGGIQCTLTGWGYTNGFHIGPLPNDLQRITLSTITNEQCEADGMSVDSTGICTEARFARGACSGDSGGPLASGDELIGIVSYGTGICAIGLPDVYTRVSDFYEWIGENTKMSSLARRHWH